MFFKIGRGLTLSRDELGIFLIDKLTRGCRYRHGLVEIAWAQTLLHLPNMSQGDGSLFIFREAAKAVSEHEQRVSRPRHYEEINANRNEKSHSVEENIVYKSNGDSRLREWIFHGVLCIVNPAMVGVLSAIIPWLVWSLLISIVYWHLSFGYIIEELSKDNRATFSVTELSNMAWDWSQLKLCVWVIGILFTVRLVLTVVGYKLCCQHGHGIEE